MEPMDPHPPNLELMPRRAPLLTDALSSKYFGRRLHDSRIIGIDVWQDVIRLKVDDYDVWRLSTAFEGAMQIPPASRFFPVTLEFLNPNAWAAFQINPIGQLSRLRRSLTQNLGKLEEFVGDLVTHWDGDRAVVYIEFRVHGARETQLYFDPESQVGVTHLHNLLLAVDCQRIEVREEQRAAWVAAYGTSAGAVLDEFQRHRSEFAQGAFEPIQEFARRAAAQAF